MRLPALSVRASRYVSGVSSRAVSWRGFLSRCVLPFWQGKRKLSGCSFTCGRGIEGEGEICQCEKRVSEKETRCRGCCKPGFKNNTAAGEIVLKKACQKAWYMDQKNEDNSESVNSFGLGAIFPSRLGHELSMDGLVVSILSFWKKLY